MIRFVTINVLLLLGNVALAQADPPIVSANLHKVSLGDPVPLPGIAILDSVDINSYHPSETELVVTALGFADYGKPKIISDDAGTFSSDIVNPWIDLVAEAGEHYEHYDSTLRDIAGAQAGLDIPRFSKEFPFGFPADSIEVLRKLRQHATYLDPGGTLTRVGTELYWNGEPITLMGFGWTGALTGLNFDPEDYLDVLEIQPGNPNKDYGANLTRVWAIEQWTALAIDCSSNNSCTHDADGNGTPDTIPGNGLTPFEDISPLEWDLEEFNDQYMSRLRQFVEAAWARGIVVQLTLFDRHGLRNTGSYGAWQGSPYNEDNNDHGELEGGARCRGAGFPCTPSDFLGEQGTFAGNVNSAFIARIKQELAPYGNVIIEIMNEPLASEWGETEIVNWHRWVADQLKGQTHTLTVTLSGTGSGTVTSNPPGINCPGDCTEDYAEGTGVDLDGTAAEGSTPAVWGEACVNGHVTMSADRNCTVTFNLTPVSLNAHYPLDGDANDALGVNHGVLEGFSASPFITDSTVGTAALRLDGIDDRVAIQELRYNSTGLDGVSVSAWVRTTDGSRQVIASFDRNEYWRLEIDGTGGGLGQIGWDVRTAGGTIDFGSNSRVDDGGWHHVVGVFDGAGQEMRIFIDGVLDNSTAIASTTFGSGVTRFGFLGVGSEATTPGGNKGPNWYFQGDLDDVWIFDRAVSLAEVLDLYNRGNTFHTLTIGIIGPGSVTSSPAGIDCGSDCSQSYAEDTVVTLTPTPLADFIGWSGHSDCYDGVVTMDGDRSCTATFDIQPTHTLTVTIAGTGTVTSDPAGIDCGSDCSHAFAPGTLVKLAAKAGPGNSFAGWGGAADCADGYVTLSASLGCTATFATQQAGSLSFDGLTVSDYGGSGQGSADTTGGGGTLHLRGNGWGKIDFPYTVTTATVLELDFISGAQGDVQGIGFAIDNDLAPDSFFKVYGTQWWGIQVYNDYAASAPASKHYVIPVGQHFTGSFAYLTFGNDCDPPCTEGDSYYSNIRVYENGQLIDFNNVTLSHYGGSGQGTASTATPMDGGATLHIEDNGWHKIVLDYTVTANTMLELDFRSPVEGEVQGVGFDIDNSLSSDRFFQLYGTTTGWGIDDYEDYAASAPNTKHYVIPVGQHFDGNQVYLTFGNDCDLAPCSNPVAESFYSNVLIYELLP